MDTLANSSNTIERLWELIKIKKVPDSVNLDQLYLGVDIGTANVVSVVINGDGEPVAGEIEPGHVVREGIVVDYFQAVQMVRRQLDSLEQRLGRELKAAVSAVPPGTEHNNGRVTKNILEAACLDVCAIIDEPSAASCALRVRDGAVIDVGGGTTGISVLRDGNVIYTGDEPTGGFHLDLVIAGGLKLTTEEAEQRKCDPSMQKILFPVVRPVFEKIITIAKHHLKSFSPEAIYLVGGPCAFPGFQALVEKELSLPVYLPPHPLLVTPLGISLTCRELCMNQQKGSA